MLDDELINACTPTANYDNNSGNQKKQVVVDMPAKTEQDLLLKYGVKKFTGQQITQQL